MNINEMSITYTLFVAGPGIIGQKTGQSIIINADEIVINHEVYMITRSFVRVNVALKYTHLFKKQVVSHYSVSVGKNKAIQSDRLFDTSDQ